MNLREFYQTHYFHETDRRDQINNSLAIPLGVISLVSGAFLVIAKEIDYPFNSSEIIQLHFLGLTALALILAAIFMGRTYWGYGYAHMPRTEEIRQYCESLKKHYISLNYGEDKASEQAHEETLQYVDSQYSANAEQNAENNDIKSANLFKANGLTMASVVFLVISAVPYVLNSIEEPSEFKKSKLQTMPIRLAHQRLTVLLMPLRDLKRNAAEFSRTTHDQRPPRNAPRLALPVYRPAKWLTHPGVPTG